MNSSLNNAFRKSFVDNVSGIVHQKVLKAIGAAYETIQYHNPIWSGQMVASWNVAVNTPNYTVKYHPSTMNGTVRITRPSNPLPRKSLEDALNESNVYGFELGQFNKYYITNGHKYSFGVDQGVAPYTGDAKHMIKHGSEAAMEQLKR